MKLKGYFILANGEIGRSAYIVGTADEPAMSNIYATEKDATDFTAREVVEIIARFCSRIRFEIITY